MQNQAIFRIGAVAACLAAGWVNLAADTYHVAPGGDDANDGRTAETAFASIQRGVDALAAGDVLEIHPGEYTGPVERAGLGAAGVDTTIRAVVPGTALIRGDVPVAGFEKVDRYRWVYAVDVDRPVHGVNERDTLAVLDRRRSPADLDFDPGGFFYDADAGRLYISTSDMREPSAHEYSATLWNTHGLHLIRPEGVVVEGLAVTGFSAEVERERTGLGYGVKWGIFLDNPNRCTIRDSHAYLNGGGIAYHRTADGRDNLIERCVAFANVGAYDAGGGIKGHSSDHDEIRDSLAYRCGDIGIGFYGQGIRGPSILRNNIAWGNGTADLRIKGGGNEHGLAENCITFGNLDVQDVRRSIIGDDNIYNREPGADVIFLHAAERARADLDFADPLNLDFRLQADSQYRGTGPDGTDRGVHQYHPNIFYLSPAGNDTADGLSVQSAWQSLDHALAALRPGDTLYLLAGTYPVSRPLQVAAAGTRTLLRGRGTDRVEIQGGLTIRDSSGVSLERLAFAGGVAVENGSDIAFDNCTFAGAATGLEAARVNGLRVTHCVFAPCRQAAVRLRGVGDLHLSGVVFGNVDGAAVDLDAATQVRFAGYNSYARKQGAWVLNGGEIALPDLHAVEFDPEFREDAGIPVVANAEAVAGLGPLGRPIGLSRSYESRPMRVTQPVVHAVSDATVDIEWWTSAPAECVVRWGPVGGEMVEETVVASGYATFSLDALEAGTNYAFELGAVQPRGLAAEQLVTGIEGGHRLQFTTADRPAPPVTYFVTTDGDDSNSGTSHAAAFRSIGRAAAVAGPGDTVVVGAGSYNETVRVRSTGAKGRPIVFQAAPGERVVFNGDQRTLTSAFLLSRKNHIVIDGFHFEGFGMESWDGIVTVIQSDHATIRRCFATGGRGRGTSPRFVYAEYSSGLTIENCAIVSLYEGVVARGCPNLTIRNNVFLRNLIQAVIVNNNPAQPVAIENNVFTDSHTGKARVFYLELARVESLTENNNLFYMRLPDAERQIFAFYGNEEYERAMAGYGIPAIYPAEPLIAELTRMSLADYQRRFAPQSSSLFGDPVFAKVLEMDAGERGQYQGDRLPTMVTDFHELFVTAPEFAERGFGLQPEVFERAPSGGAD